MIFYSGLGYLVPILFIAPFIVIAGLLYKALDFDVLRATSWWPLHSLIVLGAILVVGVGWLANRNKVAEVTYEKSGPVTVLKPRHTLYWIRMEYWGPIGLAIYSVLAAIRYYR
jgi:hypothetical protein